MIRETRCLLLVCDCCAVVMTHPETEGEIHYDTAERARADATEDLDWSGDGERDRCPRCTCTAQGHDWPEASQLRTYRWCHRCGVVEAQNEGGALR